MYTKPSRFSIHQRQNFQIVTKYLNFYVKNNCTVESLLLLPYKITAKYMGCSFFDEKKLWNDLWVAKTIQIVMKHRGYFSLNLKVFNHGSKICSNQERFYPV